MEQTVEIDPIEVRTSLGWSQQRMAEFLGCHQATVSRFENKRSVTGPAKRLYAQLREKAAALSSKGDAA